MPGMSGVEFLRAVRQVDMDVPVILMTGAPSVDSAMEAVEYGAFRYLQKPVREKMLEETVRRAARYHALTRLKRDALALKSEPAAQWPADRAALEGRFQAAQGGIWMAFQPIVSYRKRAVHAYEVLLRSEEPTLAGPSELIRAAEELGRLSDLGRAVRAKSAEAMAQLPKDVLLFVNLHPVDLNDPALYNPDSPLARASSRVVLEITERSSLHSIVSLQTKLTDLRTLGFRLAVDDLGAGYAGLTSMAQLEPEYVKLDMSLIRGLDRHPTQRKLVKSMVDLCRELDKQVIAEGIEDAAERDALVDVGCDLLQGFFFARPARELPAVNWT
jgi:EAL domain-containing protein (putative c-di-GMP-specific phosphodiesterase class I)